ncbi:GumC family protein, partial [Mucilaginibacter sp.]
MDDSDGLNSRAILIKYSSYWPLFLVSFVIAMAGAFAYYKYAKPVYQITASLEIQDRNDKPSEEKSSLVEFQELEKVNAPKVVENEIEILKSNQLIKAVVDYFQLWANYKLKGSIIKDEDLYGISPVKFNLYKATGSISSQKLEIQILDTNTYLLLTENGKVNKYHFGDTITNNIGSWSITGAGYSKQYIDSVIQINLTDPEATILSYQNSLKVEAQEKPGTVINLSISDQNIKRGEDFINYLIYSYKQAEILEKNKTTKSTLEFINNRLDSLSGQLNNAENNMEGYLRGNGLTDVGAQSQIYLQEVHSNEEKLNEINIQLNIINKLKSYLSVPGNNDTNIPSTLGISDPQLVNLVQKLSDIQLERNKLLATLPERNPAFEPLNRQISAIKYAIKEDISNIKSSLLTTKQSLQSYKSNSQSSIESVPGQQRQLAGLGRQQFIKEKLYNYLLQEHEQISLTYASSSSNVRLVNAAYALPIKASKRYMPFGIALLMGLLLPAGFIYGKGLVKHAVSTRLEIEIATSIPVIAEFSYIKLPSEIVIDNINNKDSFISIEQFRHLRTQLNFLNQSVSKGNFTLITSSVANEGKSFISSNLAVSLANSGKKTILLEIDIYKPKISARFKLPGSIGLTEYLNGTYRKEEIIQKPEAYPNLHIIGCGAFIDNLSELLEQQLFRNLLNDLSLEYDHILFDTPPIHSINDAYILAKFCNVTLYVVRSNYTSKSLLPFI